MSKRMDWDRAAQRDRMNRTEAPREQVDYLAWLQAQAKPRQYRRTREVVARVPSKQVPR
jgi:hypothetical protein